MADENSNSLDVNKLWQDDDEMRATLEKYVKICENCLFQFDQCLDHPSKEQILVPLKIIIRHLFMQTSLLYNGWKKSEETWIKKLNALIRKNAQKEAMDLYEWNILKAKMQQLKKTESSSKDTIGDADSSDQEEASTITHAHSPKRIVQSDNETKGSRNSFEDDRLFSSSPKEKQSDEKPTNQRLSIEKEMNERLSIKKEMNERLSIEKPSNERLSVGSPINERLSVGSRIIESRSVERASVERTSLPNSEHGKLSEVASFSPRTSNTISRPFHNSTDEFCKCQCEDYLLSKRVVEIMAGDCQCVVMQNVKPSKIRKDELKQTNNTYRSNSDYCQCCKCYE